jgi:outer membrane protein
VFLKRFERNDPGEIVTVWLGMANIPHRSHKAQRHSGARDVRSRWNAAHRRRSACRIGPTVLRNFQISLGVQLNKDLGIKIGHPMKKPLRVLLVLVCTAVSARSQTATDSVLELGTLQNCVRYALQHQPLVQRSLLDEEITESAIRGKLADWFPQLNFNFTIQHYPQAPVAIVQGIPTKTGLQNSSTGQFLLTQTIFNRDVLLAASTAHDVRTRMQQLTSSDKIDVVVNTGKAFYAVLATEEQIRLLQEDIRRLEQSLKDAYERYQGGIVDNIDYKRATIALNTGRIEKKRNEELLKVRFASLKEVMGYPIVAELKLQYDSTQMEHEVQLDTNQTVRYENRIEYLLLQSEKNLQEADLAYYKWSFLPSLSAFGTYNLNYMNDAFSRLYNTRYPNSVFGLQLSFPIFEGGKRLDEIQQARLELNRYDYDFSLLRNSINTEYTQAVANYKSNLTTYVVLKDNLELAREVYRTIQLQYKAGTKTYLEVITAETDLRSAEINYADALYQVLSSKLDVQKALGTIAYQ